MFKLRVFKYFLSISKLICLQFIKNSIELVLADTVVALRRSLLLQANCHSICWVFFRKMAKYSLVIPYGKSWIRH